ncbi:hypothetical protein DAF78_01960 [Clostridioides difficile]|nr:hypothetical protein [Clostridioides difficile]
MWRQSCYVCFGTLIFLARFVPPFVVAYQPNGSPYIERIRFALYCVAVILRRFLCQGSKISRTFCAYGKGRTQAADYIKP